MKYIPARPTPSYEEMEAYERGYMAASEERTIMNMYPDPALQTAFARGWEDKISANVRDEVMSH